MTKTVNTLRQKAANGSQVTVCLLALQSKKLTGFGVRPSSIMSCFAIFSSCKHMRQMQRIIPPPSPHQFPAQPVIWQDEWSVFRVSSLLPLADLLPQSAFRLLDLSLSPLAEGRRGREEEIISLLITYHRQWNPTGCVPARYISKGNGGGQSVTQGRYLWKMTVCKYLNLGQGCSSDTEECCKIGRVSSQHLFHQDLSNLQWSLDSLGIAGTSRPLSIGCFHLVCMDQSKEL